MIAVLFGNAIFHLRATIRMRRYSPGVVTGVALYVPLAICGYAVALHAGVATVETAIVSAAMGSSYQFVSIANHRRRAAKSSPVIGNGTHASRPSRY